jgi:hypothetical protein
MRSSRAATARLVLDQGPIALGDRAPRHRQLVLGAL